MANPRKRKLAKVAVLLCEQTDSTDVAAQMQAIADGTSIYSTNGGLISQPKVFIFLIIRFFCFP